MLQSIDLGKHKYRLHGSAYVGMNPAPANWLALASYPPPPKFMLPKFVFDVRKGAGTMPRLRKNCEVPRSNAQDYRSSRS